MMGRRQKAAKLTRKEDQLIQLPDGILSKIISMLPLKEAVRTSVLSERWQFIWINHADLYFDSANILGSIVYSNSISNCQSELDRKLQRCKFIKRVNHFMHQRCKGTKVDSFAVQFPLSKDSALHIDQWISSAITKGVENIDLDLSESCSFMVDHASSTASQKYEFPCWLLVAAGKRCSVKHLQLASCSLSAPPGSNSLTSLSTIQLQGVNISDQQLENLLSSCLFLEGLSLHLCNDLVNLQFAGPNLRLKLLSVQNCIRLQAMELCAKDLVLLEYTGHLISLYFKNVPRLAEAFLNFTGESRLDGGIYALTRFVSDLPQLETFNFVSILAMKILNLPETGPTFTNIKQFVLTVFPFDDEDKLCWISYVLKAFPLLQKLQLNGLNDEGGVEDIVYQPLKNPRQGGFKGTIFIFAMMGLDNIGFVANMASMVLYFLYVIHFDLSGSATTTTNYLGTVFLLTLVGGFISDTYMNRLNTCLLFGTIQLLGYLLLIVQSHFHKLQPEFCGKSSCVHGTKGLLFYASIFLVALGGGGIRGSVPALGADQFDQNEAKESKYIATFFNWFLLSITVGASVGVTVVVWVSTNVGWDKGFIISMVCAFLGLCFISLGKPFYRIRMPGESALSSVLQVLVVTIRNWAVRLPENSRDLYETRGPESASYRECIPHTNQFRLLDKAAVLPEGIIKPKKWRVCTVTQVEEVKILTRMMPILLSTILMNTCLAQLQTFSVQQGTLMNTKLGGFDVPAASIPVIPLVFMSLLIPVYEFAFVPIMRKFTGHPNGITHLQRVGVGLVLSVISMGMAGFIEVKRKNEIIHHNHRISLFWLSFHYAVFGIADMFTFVGLLEFFYSEAPAGKRSLSTSFSFLSLSIGYYLSSAFVGLINLVSAKLSSSKRGWLEGLDMNKNRVELFYWFLAILSILNFVNYVFWAKWFKYKRDVPIDGQKLLIRPHPDESVSVSA